MKLVGYAKVSVIKLGDRYPGLWFHGIRVERICGKLLRPYSVLNNEEQYFVLLLA